MKNRNEKKSRKHGRSNVALKAKRWMQYSLAGFATVVASSASTAKADGVFTDLNVTLDNQGFTFDISVAPDVFFTFVHQTNYMPGLAGSNLQINAFAFSVGSNSYVEAGVQGFGNVAARIYLSNLAYGQQVISTQFERGGIVAYGSGGRYGLSDSQFINTGGYVGLAFTIGSGIQFGWAELVLQTGAPNNVFVLEGIYLGEEGEDVFAGVIPNAVPEAGSLGLLAMGAAGLTLWRRKRKPAGAA